MDNKTISFTAANSLPVKIFKNNELIKELNRGHISPVHVQLIPTNRCNLSCKFCSCKNRNKNDELTLGQIETLCQRLQKLGCKSATITGGGEPLMHADISLILDCLYNHDIKIGLVTNGLLLHRLKSEDFDKITWCRISCADERPLGDNAKKIIKCAIKKGKDVDWAFSYVVGKDLNIENLNRYIEFANEYNFTHVRIVSDLLDLSHVSNMEDIKKNIYVEDKLVIYQGRKDFDRGEKNCWISLLKPMIGADGFIYPCCGVQYAHQKEDLDNPKSMQMGRMEEIESLYKNQKKFDGSQCYRCYYKNYNDILEQMIGEMSHVEFV